MADGVGREDYADYYFLWHLIALGSSMPRRRSGPGCPTIGGAVWDDPRHRQWPADHRRPDRHGDRPQPSEPGRPAGRGRSRPVADRLGQCARPSATHRHGATYAGGPRPHRGGPGTAPRRHQPRRWSTTSHRRKRTSSAPCRPGIRRRAAGSRLRPPLRLTRHRVRRPGRRNNLRRGCDRHPRQPGRLFRRRAVRQGAADHDLGPHPIRSS